ncbi:MAG TPA: acetyl-coenzyme A synthetase N-terminal domain-containing protein, partial [Flavobacterium sp.]
MNYKEFYTNSIDQPEAFWKEQAMAIEWYKKPETI